MKLCSYYANGDLHREYDILRIEDGDGCFTRRYIVYTEGDMWTPLEREHLDRYYPGWWEYLEEINPELQPESYRHCIREV